MKIEKITEQKKRFLNLLLLADEQESMIDRYLDEGDMYALYDDDLKGVCVVTPGDDGSCELKNIAVYEDCQGKGYGKQMIDYLTDVYSGSCHTMYVGTGDSPLTVPFYKKCGFTESHRIKNFFTDNYDHPIFECGIQLVDMVYLKKAL